MVDYFKGNLVFEMILKVVSAQEKDFHSSVKFEGFRIQNTNSKLGLLRKFGLTPFVTRLV